MICPNCLVDVQQFDASPAHERKKGYQCPACKESVPENYVTDYRTHPPVVFFLMGLPGHGKNLYLAHLFAEFESIGEKWQEFFYTPLQEGLLQTVRERQHALERGEIPEPARNVFPKPAILRLSGVPEMGNCQLLIYDVALEEQPEPRERKYLAGYFGRNKVVVLLLSLQDLQTPTELTDLLTRYRQTLDKLGGDSSEQTLIVALTKGDRLLDTDTLPDKIGKMIQDGEVSLEDKEEGADVLSGIIEAWLETQRETMNFVRRAKTEFKEMIYTVTSAPVADSAKETSGATIRDVPRSVWQPLLLAWNVQQPLLKRARRRETHQIIERAASESVREVTRCLVGGAIGLIEGAVWGALLWAIVGGFEAFLGKLELNAGLAFALRHGYWGAIWGALVWMIAGTADAARGGEAYFRSGVRFGAVMGLLLNGIIAGIVWGIALTVSSILREGGTFSAPVLLENARVGLVVGARIGALLGALWGLVVQFVDTFEIRLLSGAVWSLLIAAIVGVLSHIFIDLPLLFNYVLWGIGAATVFGLWATTRRG